MKNRFEISIVFVLLSLGALNAQVGIGTTTPSTSLQVESNAAGEFGLLSSNFTGNGAGINFQDQTTTSRFHVGIAAYGNNMNFRVGNAYQATLTSGGYFGIGTLTPHAPIHLANFLGNNRQILLYEEANDNHQFYGFGINASVLRYQIANLSASHVFYGGLNATTSNELFRIRGNGSVGVGGVAAPVAKLEVNGYIKVGTTDDIADPVAPVPGMIRYNSTTDRFEGYCGPLAPGGAGWKTLN